MEQADGLMGTVAGKDRFLLRSPRPALKLVGDKARHIKSGVLQQFLADADRGGQLMRTQGDLIEGHIALGDLLLFLDPGGGAVTGDQRDLPVARFGGDHVHQAAHDVLFLERFHQLMLVR